MFIKTHIPRFVRSFLKAWHSQYGCRKLRRGLDLSLIRSCGAKSNQSKREQRAKPCPFKRVSVVCSVWLLSQQDSVFGGWLLWGTATSLPFLVHMLPLSSCLSCIVSNSQGKREWEGWRVFASYSSPCSHCLTLTSQYDTKCNLRISSWHYHCSPCCGGMGSAALA